MSVNVNSFYRTLIVGPKYGKLIPNRIFVGGIRGDTTDADLQKAFSSYGNVVAAKVVLDNSGVSKGYGFVTFETEQEVQRLQRTGESIVLKERKLNIAPAFKKQHLVTNDAIYYSPVPRNVFAKQHPINYGCGDGGGGLTGGGNYCGGVAGPGCGGHTDMPAFCPPPLIHYQPLYQYYGVPMDMPAAYWQ